MKPLSQSLLAVAGALLLSFCSNNSGNPNGGNTDGIGTLNVNGKVVNQAGQVSANVPLVIKSGAAFSVTTSTFADGNFVVANVPTPYDVTVISLNPTGATVSVGLTSATPTVLDMLSSSPFTGGGSASLSGTVTGGIGFPAPGDYKTSVLFASAELQTNDYLVADNTTGGYSTDDAYFDFDGESLPVTWLGPATTTGTVHALQSEAAFGDEPITYSGYGFKENVSLANGSVVTGQDIALTAVATAAFSGTYTPPAGYTVDQREMALKFGSGGLMLLEFDPSSTEAFSYNTPKILGATLVLASTAVKLGEAYSSVINLGLAVDATGVAITSPAAAELNLPLEGATGVTTGTPFSWTAVPGAVHLVVMGLSGAPGSSVTYVFLTSDTTVTLPDLTSAGLSLPASNRYGWMVYGVGPYADVEAASAGLSGAHQWVPFTSVGGYVVNWGLVNSDTGGFVTNSLAGHFTTAPLSARDETSPAPGPTSSARPAPGGHRDGTDSAERGADHDASLAPWTRANWVRGSRAPKP